MTWRLPAEWEPQESVWLVWPRDPTTWPDGRIEGARQSYITAIEHLSANQQVNLVVHPDLMDALPTQVRDHERVAVWPTDHTDSWIRDYGPLTVCNDEGAARPLDFQFDAWGGKYETLAQDDAVTGCLSEAGAWSAERIPFILEGGAIDTDGQGTFLCTRTVAAGRGQTEDQVEAVLRQHLGAKKVLWLDEGISGDDTDGHIDTITRFVAPRTVVTSVEPDMEHPDHRSLLVNREALHTMTDALGRPLEVIDLPMPELATTREGNILPRSHANFLIANDVVLLPTFGGVSDAVAADILHHCFPDRRIVGIDHTDLIWGFGGIHCLSMQFPRCA